MKRKIVIIVGTRPNFIKVLPIIKELRNFSDLEPLLIHTGQHYDYEMSKTFFDDLKLPEPKAHLGIGSGSHAEQTGKIMMALEKEFLKEKPDVVLVLGDVNSTLAAALVASKIYIPIAHVEAGMRSFDRTMPEEINRIFVDRLSTYLFTTAVDDSANLIKEGISEENIYLVGNVMIDTLIEVRNRRKKANILNHLNLEAGKYCILTLHRAGNVDEKKRLLEIFEAIQVIAKNVRVVFPMHPRTKKGMEEFGLMKIAENPGFHIIEPLNYSDFLSLEENASFVMTDSGGIQAETSFLGVSCLTLRDNTEWKVTLSIGTNVLVGCKREKILKEVEKILNGKDNKCRVPELWDGKTAKRVVEILKQNLS